MSEAAQVRICLHHGTKAAESNERISDSDLGIFLVWAGQCFLTLQATAGLLKAQVVPPPCGKQGMFSGFLLLQGDMRWAKYVGF